MVGVGVGVAVGVVVVVAVGVAVGVAVAVFLDTHVKNVKQEGSNENRRNLRNTCRWQVDSGERMTILRFILRLLFRGCITDPHDPVAEWSVIAYPAVLTAEQCQALNAERWQD